MLDDQDYRGSASSRGVICFCFFEKLLYLMVSPIKPRAAVTEQEFASQLYQDVYKSF